MKSSSIVSRVKRVVELLAVRDITARIGGEVARKAQRSFEHELFTLKFSMLNRDQAGRVEELVHVYGSKWAASGKTRTIRRAKRDAADKAARAEVSAMAAAVDAMGGGK